MVDVIYEVIRKFVVEQGLGVSLVVVLFLGIYYFVKNGEFVFRYPRPKDASKDKWYAVMRQKCAGTSHRFPRPLYPQIFKKSNG